jgi:arylsulfatase A-like enzyme
MTPITKLSSLGLLLLAAASVWPSPAAATRPDVLVFLTDQWNPRYTSWENPQVRTPNLDRLAREGMIFDACYVPSPVCMPARVSLITGLYPHNHGHALWSNALQYHAPPEHAPMFRDIQRAGYTTAQIGKTHWTSGTSLRAAFKNEAEYHRALGLDFVMQVNGPPSDAREGNPYTTYLKQLGLLETLANDMRGRYLKSQYEPRASVLPPEHYHDTFVTGEAVKFIAAQPADKPLCLVVSLHSPHPPLDAPGDFATMFDPEKLTLPPNVPDRLDRDGRAIDAAEARRIVANYLGKIAHADACLGRLVAAFEQRGTWTNTLVLFTSDHGELLGAHGKYSKGRFEEESARVPLVIRWPGVVQAGRTAALAEMFDVYPTIVEAIGGELTPGRSARSLLPVATGRVASVRDLAISEIGTVPPLRMMARDARYKWCADEQREYLYDLRDDPWEMKNLANDPAHRDLLHQMREKMLTHLRRTQVNYSADYVPKVKRLRDEEAEKQGVTPKPRKKKQE